MKCVVIVKNKESLTLEQKKTIDKWIKYFNQKNKGGGNV